MKERKVLCLVLHLGESVLSEWHSGEQENRRGWRRCWNNSVSPHRRGASDCTWGPCKRVLGKAEGSPRDRSNRKELSLSDFLIILALGVCGPWLALYQALFLQAKNGFHWGQETMQLVEEKGPGLWRKKALHSNPLSISVWPLTYYLPSLSFMK